MHSLQRLAQLLGTRPFRYKHPSPEDIVLKAAGTSAMVILLPDRFIRYLKVSSGLQQAAHVSGVEHGIEYLCGLDLEGLRTVV